MNETERKLAPAETENQQVSKFKPNPKIKPRGCKGKSNKKWPLLDKAVAWKVCSMHFGTEEAALLRQTPRIPKAEFETAMLHLLPDVFSNRKGKDPVEYLLNRIYTMYYSGTADRGPHHDPATRATYSSLHIRKLLAAGHPYWGLVDVIDKGFKGPIDRNEWEARAAEWEAENQPVALDE